MDAAEAVQGTRAEPRIIVAKLDRGSASEIQLEQQFDQLGV
jgi:hypothetical protein